MNHPAIPVQNDTHPAISAQNDTHPAISAQNDTHPAIPVQNDVRPTAPAAIERESMRMIDAELSARGIVLPPEHAFVIRRVIHATADFDFAVNLRFTPDAVSNGIASLRDGVIVTDTNMALAGISRPAMGKLHTAACCLMAEETVARIARERQCTRAAVSMEIALSRYPGAVIAVGNAPTALLRVAELVEHGARPSLLLGVPVGFVNVTESKERIWEICIRYGIPAIVSMGRKGGSGVAAAICNALLYEAAGLSGPEQRETPMEHG